MTHTLYTSNNIVPDYNPFYSGDFCWLQTGVDGARGTRLTLNNKVFRDIVGALQDADVNGDGVVSQNSGDYPATIEYELATANLFALGYSWYQSEWLFAELDDCDTLMTSSDKIEMSLCQTGSHTDSLVVLSAYNFIFEELPQDAAKTNQLAIALYSNSGSCLVDMHNVLYNLPNIAGPNRAATEALNQQMTDLLDLRERLTTEIAIESSPDSDRIGTQNNGTPSYDYMASMPG